LSGFVLRILARLFALFSFRSLPAIGRIVAFLAHDVLRIRRAHVRASLRRASIHADSLDVYRELGTSACELLWLSGRPDVNAASLVTVVGRERFDEARALGRGVIVATAHTGNWDLTACACASLVPLSVVTKRLSSRSVDDFWQSTRRARGVDLVAAPDGSVLRTIRDRLAAGQAVALLVDQDPERVTSVVEADFLGATAVHDTLAATIAARTGAPIVVAFARRNGSEHVVEIIESIVPPPSADRGAERRGDRTWIAATTRRIASHLDAFVRRSPTGWLWLHRRWKTTLTPRRAPQNPATSWAEEVHDVPRAVERLGAHRCSHDVQQSFRGG
jgi:Kdo2-lipid IVA lauroyltransferase/acyltransferase